MQINIKWKEAGAGFYLAMIYAAEGKAEWKPSNSWPSEEGQNTCWFLVGSENCVSCVRLGGGGVRHKWSNYLRMRSLFGSIPSRLWPTEAWPSSTTGCVIPSLRPPRRERTFFQSSADGRSVPLLNLSSALLLSNHQCGWFHFRLVSRCRCRCQKQVRAMSWTLTHLAAHWLLNAPCKYVAFGRNGLLCFCPSFNVL